MRNLTLADIEQVSGGIGTGTIAGSLSGAVVSFLYFAPLSNIIIGMGLHPLVGLANVVHTFYPHILGSALFGAVLGYSFDSFDREN